MDEDALPIRWKSSTPMSQPLKKSQSEVRWHGPASGGVSPTKEEAYWDKPIPLNERPPSTIRRGFRHLIRPEKSQHERPWSRPTSPGATPHVEEDPYPSHENNKSSPREKLAHELRGIGSEFSATGYFREPEHDLSLPTDRPITPQTAEDHEILQSSPEVAPKLSTLYDGHGDWDCDIVFIHGLDGNAFSTWSSGSGDVLWPKDLLPNDFPKSRILSFGYKTPVWSMSDPGSADDIARSLLDRVAKMRTTEHERKNPIVWVAHSMGGFLVKACLVISRSRASYGPSASNVYDCTRGIVFFGTPHHARTRLGWANVLSRITSAVTKSATMKEVMNNSAVHTSDFMKLLDTFDTSLDQTRVAIYSFYESQAMATQGMPALVTEKSNALYHPSEVVRVIPGDHMTMCRFQNMYEQGYRHFIRALREILARVETDPRSFDVTLAQPLRGVPQTIVTEPSNVGDDEVESITSSRILSYSEKLERAKQILTAPVLERKYIPARSSGTCHWILHSAQYLNWLNSDPSDDVYKCLLLIHGPPGSGKSVVANFMVEHLEQRAKVTDFTARPYILHFFFNAQLSVHEQGAQMLHQLLQQLLEINGSLVRHFPNEKLSKDYKVVSDEMSWPGEQYLTTDMLRIEELESPIEQVNDDISPHLLRMLQEDSTLQSPFSTDELVDILLSVLRDPEVADACILLDGLDECDDIALRLIVKFFQSIVPDNSHSKIRTKLCLTYASQSRLRDYLGPVVDQVDRISLYTGSDNSNDLRLVAEQQLDILSKQQHLPFETLEEVQEELTDLTNPDFLWVMLMGQMISGLPNLGHVNRLRAGIKTSNIIVQKTGQDIHQNTSAEPAPPTEISGALGDLYDWIFDYIVSYSSPLAFYALSFVVLAERPVSLHEMGLFLAVEESLLPRTLRYLPITKSGIANNPPFDINFKAEDLLESVRLDLRAFLERELFGLLVVKDGILSLVHPSLKTSISAKLWWSQRIHGHFAAICLTLLAVVKRGDNRLSHDDFQVSTEVDWIKYASVHWATHLKKMGASAAALQPLVEEVWSNEQLQPLFLKLARKRQPRSLAPTLTCALAAFDLPHNLKSALKSSSTETPNKYLSMELRYAIANGASEAVEVLVEMGHDVKRNDEYRQSAMDYAVMSNNVGVARYLSKSVGLDGDVPATFLRLLAKEITRTKTDWLLTLDVPKLPERRADLLFSVIQVGNENMVHELLSTNLELSPDDTQTALETAVDAQKDAIVARLLTYVRQNDYQARVKLGQCLCLAAKRADVGITRRLLESGANTNEKNGDGPSALHEAAGSGRLELVQSLIEARARKTAEDDKGMRPIHWAAKRGHAQIVEVLISPSTDMDRFGRSSLYLACKSGSFPTISVLLEYGVSINKKDNRGRTALHVAAASGSPQMVRMLLAAGANATIQSNMGSTPLHEAAHAGWLAVVDELLAAGGKRSNDSLINARDKSQRTALHVACLAKSASADLVKLLLDRGANCNNNDVNQRTPLHLAALNARADILEVLLSRGDVDPNIGDYAGHRPIHLACSSRVDFAAKLNILLRKNATWNTLADISYPTSQVSSFGLSVFSCALRNQKWKNLRTYVAHEYRLSRSNASRKDDGLAEFWEALYLALCVDAWSSVVKHKSKRIGLEWRKKNLLSLVPQIIVGAKEMKAKPRET